MGDLIKNCLASAWKEAESGELARLSRTLGLHLVDGPTHSTRPDLESSW